mgnify:CR=1 FL=1
MRLVACLIVALAFFALLEKPIKKHATYFYIGTIIISILSIMAPKKGLPFVVDYLVKNILTRGTLAGALYPGYGGIGVSTGKNERLIATYKR